MSVLVFGASGFLGSWMRTCLERRGETVIGTYFSAGRVGLRHFDLRKDSISILGSALDSAGFAVICSSITDMERCKTEWDATYDLNVDRSRALILQLQDIGITPIFISTDYVYDGRKGNYSEDDEKNPILAYGRQKAEVENFLISRPNPYIIVRPAWIYSYRTEDCTLLTSIASALRSGRTLRMATAQIFTPCYVEDVCNAVGYLMQKRIFGCYNLAPCGALSRFELALQLQEKLGLRAGQISPCLLRDLPFVDRRPLDTSLDSRRFLATGGFEFTTIKQSLEHLAHLF